MKLIYKNFPTCFEVHLKGTFFFNNLYRGAYASFFVI